MRQSTTYGLLAPAMENFKDVGDLVDNCWESASWAGKKKAKVSSASKHRRMNFSREMKGRRSPSEDVTAEQLLTAETAVIDGERWTNGWRAPMDDVERLHWGSEGLERRAGRRVFGSSRAKSAAVMEASTAPRPNIPTSCSRNLGCIPSGRDRNRSQIKSIYCVRCKKW